MSDNLFKDVRNLRELVFQAIGAGSVCWENPGGAGVFDDQHARRVAEDFLTRLQQLESDATVS